MLFILKGPEVISEWFTIHLSQKTPPNHANQEVQIFTFMFTFRNTHEIAQAIEGMHIRKSHQVHEGRHFYRSTVCHSVITVVGSVGVPRPNGLDTGSVAPKVWWIFLHVLKNAEGNAGLKGLDVDSLVAEHIHSTLSSLSTKLPVFSLVLPFLRSHRRY